MYMYILKIVVSVETVAIGTVCVFIRRPRAETCQVRLVGVVHRADALTSTLALCQRCVT